ncbi:cutinase-domain-containing protein [Tricladium varicosporioides]|nr:cutinase-domain-containing protein [Hymenoscyphus varicosporioides]
MRLSPFILTLLPLASAFPLDIPILRSILPRDLTATTQNDLVNGTPCKKVTVIFARGTTSPGNVGESTGPPFFQAIAALVGTNNIAVQGVDYPASILGFLEGGDTAGGKLMANLTARAMTQCPDTKVVMSGYSQGGQLVHKAAKQLSAAVAAKVSSVVIFGDPDNGTAVGVIAPSKVLIVCHSGDEICKGSIIVTSDHLNYANDAASSAAFVVKAAGL